MILLDEPTSASGPASTGRIDELEQDLMVVIVTDNMGQAARCADQVVLFSLGVVIEAGPAARMLTAPKQPRGENYLSDRSG